MKCDASFWKKKKEKREKMLKGFQKWWEFMKCNKDCHYCGNLLSFVFEELEIDFPLFATNLQASLICCEKPFNESFLRQNSIRLIRLSVFHHPTTAHRKWRIMKSMLMGWLKRIAKRKQSSRAVPTNVSSVKNLFRDWVTWRSTNRWVNYLTAFYPRNVHRSHPNYRYIKLHP